MDVDRPDAGQMARRRARIRNRLFLGPHGGVSVAPGSAGRVAMLTPQVRAAFLQIQEDQARA
jgi:hypothetical protein